MLILPVGQENNVVRRAPWVSIALIALNVLVFLGTQLLADDERWRAQLGSCLEYLAQRPYLTVPPALSQRLGPAFEQHVAAWREQWAASERSVDPQQQADEQVKLERLSWAALDALQALPIQRLGYVPAAPQAQDALTSLFVHAGFMHLLGNMLFLFLTGPFLEDRYGRVLFPIFYLLSGLAALATHVSQARDSLVPLVGASGAIAGLMGAFLLRLGRERIQLLILPVPVLWFVRFLRWHVAVPAFVVLPLWFGEQLLLAHLAPEDAGVAFWAHVGGFVFGFAAALGLRLARIEERYVHPVIEGKVALVQDPALEQALEARLQGDFDSARSALRAALARRPDSLDAWRESYETALAAGDVPTLGRSLARLVELYERRGERDLLRDLAYDGRWRDVSELDNRARLALAATFEKLADARSALEEYDRVIARDPQEPSSLRALVRRAVLLRRGGDSGGARQAYERARAHPACTGTWPATIERALEELRDPNP
jgi:membrane associated rhomboid family serine protease